MPNDRLLIVRNLVLAEIRECDDNFKTVHSFKNIGDEVIAIDVYFNTNKIIMNELELDNIQINNPINIYLEIQDFPN